MYVRMKVAGIAIDPVINTPIVILKDLEEHSVVPIWIGILEASAIAAELEKVELTRPLTHVLLRNTLDSLKVTLDKIEINDLKDNTFYATLFLNNGKKVLEIDARPSDAIALSLNMGSNIYVKDEIIEKSVKVTLSDSDEQSEFERKKWAEILENLSEEDFGKYKM
ncbi:bifunctional nuclease family protein [Thermodesulfobacteriota bacterium]